MSSIITTSENDKESVVHNEKVGLSYNAQLETLAELDEAAVVLQNAGHIEFSVEEDRRILRLVDLWVLSTSFWHVMCGGISLNFDQLRCASFTFSNKWINRRYVSLDKIRLLYDDSDAFIRYPTPQYLAS
jgi:hypothetical protein